MKAETTKAEPRGPGRPVELTAELQRCLVEHLREANPIAVSCQLCGCSKSAFYEWKSRFPEFAEAVTHARAEAKRKLIKIVVKAAVSDSDWRAASWLLAKMVRDSEFFEEQPALTWETARTPMTDGEVGDLLSRWRSETEKSGGTW